MQPVARAVAEVLLDRLGMMMQVGGHLADAVAAQQAQDVLHDGPIEDRHHGLGDELGKRQ